MNSKSLQKQFPEVYTDFFSKCDIVCSAPFVLNWSTNYNPLNGGPGIHQKLPFRVYVGIEYSKNVKAKEIFNFKMYLPEQNKFIDYFFEDEQKQRLINTIDYLGLYDKNYKINIISEYHYVRGLQGIGPFAVALINCLLLNSKKIGVQEINKATSFKNQIVFQDNKIINKIINKSCLLALAIEGFLSFNLGVFNSILDGEEMFLYNQDATPPKLRYASKFNIETLDKFLNKSNYSITSLKKLFKNDKKIPFDYFLIFNGFDKKYIQFFQPTKNIVHDLHKTKKFIDNHYKELYNEQNIPQKTKELLKSDKYMMLNNFRDTGTILTYELLANLYLLNKNKINTQELLINFHQISHYIQIFKDINPHISKLFNVINNWGLSEQEINAVAKPINLSDTLVIGEKMDLQLGINELEKNLKENNLSPDIYYKSWEDGLEEDGLKIEHYLAQNIYSNYYKQGNYIKSIEYYNNKKLINKHSYEKIDNIKKNADIVLDQIDNKLYFKGKALTSKEIKSAKKTIMLLTALLKSKKGLRPADLDLGSYADRNEMQSKIITPLQKAAQKHFKRKLKIELTGGLTTNYSLSFNPNNFKIIIIKD